MSERIPIDPSHPANASALLFYRSHAVLDPKKRSPWDIDEEWLQLAYTATEEM